ncbi:hypothetical protein K440DRAFT_628324 [Wilcoxina mikolae CBS 423.85]|nr:hypothetical protein K440DRAFT_628324 [Wilcoxina mikolae CBS 423.85]
MSLLYIHYSLTYFLTCIGGGGGGGGGSTSYRVLVRKRSNQKVPALPQPTIPQGLNTRGTYIQQTLSPRARVSPKRGSSRGFQNFKTHHPSLVA